MPTPEVVLVLIGVWIGILISWQCRIHLRKKLHRRRLRESLNDRRESP